MSEWKEIFIIIAAFVLIIVVGLAVTKWVWDSDMPIWIKLFLLR